MSNALGVQRDGRLDRYPILERGMDGIMAKSSVTYDSSSQVRDIFAHTNNSSDWKGTHCAGFAWCLKTLSMFFKCSLFRTEREMLQDLSGKILTSERIVHLMLPAVSN